MSKIIPRSRNDSKPGGVIPGIVDTASIGARMKPVGQMSGQPACDIVG